MITSLLEKKGGLSRLNKDSELFVDFIESARLVDILPKNGSYTWNNRRGGENHIASHLDRFLILESILLEGITVIWTFSPLEDLITGQFLWKQPSLEPLEISRSNLKSSGSLTLTLQTC